MLEVELAVQVHAKIVKEESIPTEEGVVPAASVLHEESSPRSAHKESIIGVVEWGRLGLLEVDDAMQIGVEDSLVLLGIGEELRVTATVSLILILL